MSKRRAHILLGLLLTHAGSAAAEQGSAFSPQTRLNALQRSEQSYVFPESDIPTLEDAPGNLSLKLDEADRGFRKRLWKLIAQGEYARVRNEIEKRQSVDEGWQPGEKLLFELERGELGKRIGAVRQQPAALIALSRRHPERFSCREYYHLWSLADAYAAQGKQQTASAIDREVVRKCRRSATVLGTLQRIADRDGAAAALALSRTIEKQSSTSRDGIRQLQYRLGIRLAVQLRERHAYADALDVLADFEARIKVSRDEEAGRLLAWTYHDSGNSERALVWLEHVAAWSGSEPDRLIVLQQQWSGGERSAVIRWLNANTLTHDGAAEWAASVLGGEASRLYEQERYQSCLELLDRAREFRRQEVPGNAVLRGWSYYHLGQYDHAYRSLSLAYSHSGELTLAQEQAVVEGLLYTARHTGNWQHLLSLSRSYPGTLLATQHELELAKKLSSGELGAAAVTVISGRLARSERGLHDNTFSAGIGYMGKRGKAGNDRLSLIQVPVLNAQLATPAGSLFFRAGSYRIDSGDPGTGTWIGSGQWGLDAPVRPTTSSESGRGETALGFQHRRHPLYLELGGTPHSQAVSSTWMGLMRWKPELFADSLSATLYRRPRYDSRLAYTGLDDPYSSASWGRVMQQGLGLDYYTKLHSGGELSVHLGSFALSGVGVADNRGGEAYLTSMYAVEAVTAGSLKIGPYLYVSSYSRNLNHFTLGHGGYYSPQRLLQGGMNLRWLHRDTNSLYLIESAVGYQRQHEDEVERYPLDDDGSDWNASDSQGISGRIRLSWGRQLGRSPWQLSGMLFAEEGAENGRRNAWLYLRYNFSGRGVVSESDLVMHTKPYHHDIR
jgi:hypothetical protein